VGKSYSIVAHQIARELVAKCPEIAEATCVLVSRIGWPVETPQVVELQIQTRNGVALETLREPAEGIARECLRGVTGLTRLLLDKASVESPGRVAWRSSILSGVKNSECVGFLQWALPRLGLRWRGFRKVRGQVCKRIDRRMRSLGIDEPAGYKAYLDSHSDE
jgi:hypothetical protein